MTSRAVSDYAGINRRMREIGSGNGDYKICEGRGKPCPECQLCGDTGWVIRDPEVTYGQYRVCDCKAPKAGLSP